MTDALTRTLQHLEALVAIDTRNPPRAIDLGALFGLLRAALGPKFSFHQKDLGDGCGALLATRGADPRVLINVHLDTVPAAEGWTQDPLRLQVDGGRAVGLGACDIKGAAACALTAAADTDGDIALLLTTDEEAGSSRCVRDFLTWAPRLPLALVAEPTQARAVAAHRGIATCRGAFTGTPGHASAERALCDSAVHEAARWASAALDRAQALQQQTYHGLRGVRFNLGRLEGGTKPNMIAGAADAWWGVRPLPSQDVDALLADLQALAPDPSRVTWAPGFRGPSLPAADPDGAAAAAALRAAADLGLPAGDAVDFWTEASLFSQAGWQALVFGPGDIAQAHTAHEWVALDQLAAVEQHYRRIMGGLAT